MSAFINTPTHLCGWRTAGHFSRLSQVSSQLCRLHRVLPGVRVQPGEGEVEVGDLGGEEPCVAPEEAQVGAGSLDPHAKLHYVVLVVVHPEENQRLSVQMGWVGLGQEVGGQSWSTVKQRGLCCGGKKDITFNSFSDYANTKQTYL